MTKSLSILISGDNIITSELKGAIICIKSEFAIDNVDSKERRD